MAELNVLTGVVVGEFGQAITQVIVDNTNTIIDVSTFTTRNVKLRSPRSLKTVTISVSFTTDGTDGSVYFTPSDGDIDRAGLWEGQYVFEKTGVEVHTQKFEMDVEGEH